MTTSELRLVAALLAALAALLVWNVTQFPWRQGYDATSSAHYAETLREWRLPDADDTDVWHNPPLWFALAGAVYRAAEIVGISDPGLPVQLLSSVFVLGIVLLTGVLARELFPERRVLPVLALAVAAVMPVLVRAGVLFHPEPLAALLTTAALVVFAETVRRGAYTIQAGLGAGLLIGLANLTRTWALAALAALIAGAFAAILSERRSAGHRAAAARRFALGLVVAASALVVPWLAVKTAVHGSPLAYSQPNPEQWRQEGRPREFWLALDLDDVFSTPYQPFFRNHLLPTVYSDWWGDYWRVYGVPPALKDEPDRLPDRYTTPRVRQSWVGVAGTLFAALGLVLLVVRAVRLRDVALATVLASAALLALSFTLFLWRYPKQDGDNIKALYLLNMAPVIAIACAVGLGAVASRGLVGRLVALAVGLAAVAATVPFLTLS